MKTDDLLSWFYENQRAMPWRKTKDPYSIWVSEIMLQQTQVATVIPYYERWMKKFPSVETLANAEEQDALALWQGLGYYSRCKNLLKGARWVKENGLPTHSSLWKLVPGIGPYTSAAIASISQNEPIALVDGNVERVFARINASSLIKPQITKEAWVWAEKVLSKKHPGDWNQALMELGATICTPVNPICPFCPIKAECKAFKTDTVDKYPAKNIKPKIIKLKQVVYVPYYKKTYGIRQITEGSWWKGMWEFPRTELEKAEQLTKFIGDGKKSDLGKMKHQVTKHSIEIDVFLVECSKPNPKLSWVNEEEITNYALPAPQKKIFQKATKQVRKLNEKINE